MVIKHSLSNFAQYIACRLYEGLFYILSGLGARFHKQQSLLLCPQLCFLGRHFSSLRHSRRLRVTKVHLVPDKYAGKMRVCVFSDIG
jgi:hypothetical protein